MFWHARIIPQSRKLKLTVSFVTAMLFALLCHGGENENDREASRIRIGVFSITASPQPRSSQAEFLKIARTAGMQARRVFAEDVREGVLDELDVLVIGMGDSIQYGERLGAEGGKAIEKFVRRGGGIIGTSSGGYLLARSETPPLNYVEIANAQVLFSEEEGRRRQQRVFRVAEVENVNGDRLGPMAYLSGPLWEVTDAEGFGVVQPLAKFVGGAFNPHNDRTLSLNDLSGKPAIIAGTFGEGRFVLFSFSPEMTLGRVGHSLAEDATRWVAGGTPDQIRKISWHDVFSEIRLEVRDFESGKDLTRLEDQDGQEPNPLATALTKNPTIPVLDTDDELIRLAKQSYNASLEEFRAKHNFWLQGLSSADDVLNAVDRFQQLRKQIGQDRDDKQLLKQKISFAERMEKEAETIRRASNQGYYRSIGKLTAVAYRAAAELELARLDMDEETENCISR